MKFLNFKIVLLCIWILQVFLYELVAQGAVKELKNTGDENPILEWAEVKNSKGYQLQIKNEQGDLLVDEKINTNNYELKLDTGKFEHRVGVFNKFGKLSSFTQWTPFVISRSLPPVILSEERVVGTRKKGVQKIELRGRNLYRKTKITLTRNGKQLPISKVNFIDETNIELEINNKDSELGEYDILLENPRSKNLLIKNFYELTDSEKTLAELNKDIPKRKDPDALDEDPNKKPDDKSGTLSNQSNEPERPYPYWSAGLRSSLLPGWGQYNKDQKWKGYIFGGLFVASAIYLKAKSDEYEAEKKDYRNQVTVSALTGTLSGNETITLLGVTRNESQFKGFTDSSNAVYEASLLMGGIYLANVLDATFWRIRKEEPKPEQKPTQPSEPLPAKGPYWKAAMRSALLPGWGQYYKDQKIKGYILGGGLLLGLGLFYSSLEDFNKEKENYNSSINRGAILAALSRSSTVGALSYFSSEGQFKKGQEKAELVQTVSAAVAAIYIYTVFDALFWKAPQKTTELETDKIHFFTDMKGNPFSKNIHSNSQVELGLRVYF
ncbi:MAG: DUF5683 domain-containing protein [Leptospiraceae bacterium]|nr:DUF5683 domain-containing protein [Leptospiraceae bacterium]